MVLEAVRRRRPRMALEAVRRRRPRMALEGVRRLRRRMALEGVRRLRRRMAVEGVRLLHRRMVDRLVVEEDLRRRRRMEAGAADEWRPAVPLRSSRCISQQASGQRD